MLPLSIRMASSSVIVQVARSPLPSYHSMQPPAHTGTCVHIQTCTHDSLVPRRLSAYKDIQCTTQVHSVSLKAFLQVMVQSGLHSFRK